ncbi:MAG: cation transporting ATPase C-terminal domain-containing protein, partial [Hydrogenophaga sp.]|nr:cation transporting ATPase C-terminal domain-containing protein [Hydrogenophaga sp.]
RETLLGNRAALGSCAVIVVLQALFTFAPPAQALFGTAPPDTATWLLIATLAGGIFLAVEAEKWLLRRRGVQRL